jgi:hypothetical protein
MADKYIILHTLNEFACVSERAEREKERVKNRTWKKVSHQD